MSKAEPSPTRKRLASLMTGRATLSVALAVPLLGALPPARADNRPFVYGCGVSWGNWHQLSAADATTWNSRSMDRILEMGGTNVPGNFAWFDLEPQRGVYDWTMADEQVSLAEERGLAVFAYSGLTPDWALPPEAPAESGIGYRFPPDSAYQADFDAFFQTLAARYCGRVRYYEFWNEPNGCSWINDGCSNGNMAHTYAPWLQRWYTAMKAGCADTMLAVGGLDCNSGTGSGCATYISDLYDNGAGDSFDAVAIHPYGDTNVGNAIHWSAVSGVYDVLVGHGDGDRMLWLNEYGWNTNDETLKASLIDAVLAELETPAFQMVFQARYLLLTDLPSGSDEGHDYGLCDRDMINLTITPRASWNGFRDHTKPFALDPDGDTVPFDHDNCPERSNPEQTDTDHDGSGDACDPDDDDDGYPDDSDNCPLIANPGQEDQDEDGVGDACSHDQDHDGVDDAIDNCPEIENPGQQDTDRDGVGDACETSPPSEAKKSPTAIQGSSCKTIPVPGLGWVLLVVLHPMARRRRARSTTGDPPASPNPR